MGKNHRHQKQLKSEKAKVKLKSKGSNKQLPKGLNITDASFKVKKIVIREQLKHQDESQVLSRRKLNVKDLLTRLQHYNSSVRQDAIKELKEILSEHGFETLNVQLNDLIKGTSALALDREKAIRREALKALNLILSPISKDQLLPFGNVLISYLTCAMTHIDQFIMEDSLLFLDILIQHCNNFLANNSQKILVYFLDMISKLHSQAQPGRQLTTNLNLKSTSMKWRIKVLNSLQQFLSAIVQNKRLSRVQVSEQSSKVYQVKDEYINSAIYTSGCLKVLPINFDKSDHCDKFNSTLDTEPLQDHIKSLMPLMFESWLEVRPTKQNSANVQSPISEDAASLLQCITSIIQNLIEHMETFEKGTTPTSPCIWFKSKFQNLFVKNLLNDYPYFQHKKTGRTKKSQEFPDNLSVDCLDQNLSLTYIYIWFTTKCVDKNDHLDKDSCSKVLQFITGILENWSSQQSSSISNLMRVLRVLFLDASAIWYRNKIPPRTTLEIIIRVYLEQPKKDLQTQLFSLLSDIVMDHNLGHLHGEDAFKDFVKSLPALLRKSFISNNTIQMLNRVVLQYRQWIQKELEENHDLILENAKTIQIIESDDEMNSRLMICNLFYFMDEQVYF